MLLLLGYSYPAVPQFSFTLFINELLLCLAETLPICCCSAVIVVAVVVIYYTLSICRFAMLIALRLNAFTFCLRGPVLKYSPNFDTRNGTKRGPHQSVKCVLIWPRSGEGGLGRVWVLRCGVCLN